MVSPYLIRPLRSLREASESGGAASGRDPDPRDSRPAGPKTAPPGESNPLAPSPAPWRPFTVVTGGAAGAPAEASERDSLGRGGT